MAKGRLLGSTGYPAAVARALFVVEDDLLFAQRARAAAARLGIEAQGVSPADQLTGVPINSQIVVQFNEPLSQLSLNQVVLSAGGSRLRDRPNMKHPSF